MLMSLYHHSLQVALLQWGVVDYQYEWVMVVCLFWWELIPLMLNIVLMTLIMISNGAGAMK
jgi:hypothetical protein